MQKIALKVWKNLGHKKSSGQELHAQLRKYFDTAKPYNSSYSPEQDSPYFWWNSIIDGRSSLSRLAKVIFAITPHSASCERLFSALGWMFGKRRTNLYTQTVESMAKIYRYNLNHTKQNLTHITFNSDDIQQMLDFVYEESDLLDERDEQDSIFDEELEEESEDIDEKLDIEKTISLGPWVYIDNTTLPNITRHNVYESEDEADWDPEEIISRQ